MAKIDVEIKTKFVNNKQRVMANLIYTANCFQNVFIEALKPYDLSPQQFNILRILRGAGEEVAMNVIKDLMVDKAPNLTRLSDKLISKELIERRRCSEDRRVVFMTITAKGLTLLKSIDEAQLFEKMDFMMNIEEEEARIINEFLDRIRPE